MKKKFTLALLSLFACLTAVMAAAPTVPSSSLAFPANQIDGDRFDLSFKKGGGAFRIIVVKEGGPITTLPINAADYTNANGVYGTTGTEFNGNDGFVVFRGSHSQSNVTTTISHLQPNTTYYVSIWEFNGAGVATEYLATAVTGNTATKTAPASQAVISSFTNVAGNRLTVNWTGGNGDKTLLIARKGAPVNAQPEQLKDYLAQSAFGTGSVINGDNYVVYEGSGSQANLTDLDPNTMYHFAIFEFNGNYGPVYAIPGNVNSQLTNAGPTQASGNISFPTVEGNRLTLSFSPGNGRRQLIIGRKGQPVTAVPQNGQTYKAGTVYGSGYMFPSGDFVLNYDGADRTFTNLDPSSTYYFRVYDFDIDAAGNTWYLTNKWSENNGNTAFPPATQPGSISVESMTGTSVTMKYATGQSAYRLIVVKAGSPVDAIPQDLTRYNGTFPYGQGPQITPGNYLINGQTNSNTAIISGLVPGITYHVAIWGFNGSNYPVYGTPPATASFTIPNEPTEPGMNFSTNSIEGNSMHAQWSGGNGARRLVIVRKGAPVTARPTDGITYQADPRFQYGDKLGTDQYVVYDGTNRQAAPENLEIGSTYYFAVFEYNLSGGVPDYLTSSYLQGSETTVSTPTGATSALSAGDIQATQAKINFSPGGGSGRLFLMRAGSPVNTEPRDLTGYNASATYGAQQLGTTGNYIVQKTTGSASFVVTSLTPDTRYYVTAFEYNGSAAPVFLKPGASFDFTTPGAAITPPGVNATGPDFSLADGNKLTFEWHKGDGAKRMVVIKQGSSVTFAPVDGADYAPDGQFGHGTDLGGGQYVVGNGTQESVTVTNLQPAATYYFAVFEYNGAGVQTRYLTSGHLAAYGATAATPAGGSSSLSGSVDKLAIDLGWTSGPGDGRLVVMKEGSAVNGTPADLSKYSPDPVFKKGSQISAGEYVVYDGSGNTVTVTGLEPGKTYHYAIFEYNGVDAPLYNTANAVSSSTIVPGALPLKWLSFTAKEKNGVVQLDWSTVEETNTRCFIVEHSVNSNEFTPADTIAAKGNTGRNDYHYEDGTASAGQLTYRIKQVDIDNHFTYSKYIMLQIAAQNTRLALYPNPATNATRIQLPDGLQQAIVQIYAQSGSQIKTITVSNLQQIDCSHLPKGIYYIIVRDKQRYYTEHLIIL